MFTGQDRNFDPVTCSMLPIASFFHGTVAKKPLSKACDLDRVRPEKVALAGKSFITMNQMLSTDGKPNHIFILIEFIGGLPRTYEIWRMVGDYRALLSRTTTEWQTIQQQAFPVRMEAVQIVGSKTDVLEASFSWRFNKDVPDRLFKVSDVNSKDALQW
jgi:hypothetical protein